MKRSTVIMLCGVLLGSGPVSAAGKGELLSVGHHQGSHGNTGAIVDMPQEVWTRGNSSQQPPCLRCCVWQDRSYTEGAVVKMEGVLLQCKRDEKTIGTNNLIWQIIK